jgi:hypothetical protein
MAGTQESMHNQDCQQKYTKVFCFPQKLKWLSIIAFVSLIQAVFHDILKRNLQKQHKKSLEFLPSSFMGEYSVYGEKSHGIKSTLR